MISFAQGRRDRFLRSALGDVGAGALAAEEALAGAALPRAALAWVKVASEHGWSGKVPGLPDTALELAKGEVVGQVLLGGVPYRFDTLEKAAAAVAVSAGYDPSVPIGASPRALARLGRGVEAVARGRYVTALEKAEGKVIKFPAPHPIAPALASLPQPDRKRQPKDELAAKRSPAPQKKVTTREDVDGLFGEMMDVMARDPGFKDAARKREVKEKAARLRRGPRLYRDGARVSYNEREPEDSPDFGAIPDDWTGTVTGYQLFHVNHAGDNGPHHYYNVQWRTPRGETHDDFVYQDDLKPFGGGETKKAEPGAPETGQVAKPKDPGAPEAPAAPTNGVQPKPGEEGTKTGTDVKPKRKTVLRLAKSAADRLCEGCGRSQFANGRFVGCAHYERLAKSALSISTAAGYVVELSPEAWDAESVAALTRAFGEGE